MPFAPHWRVTLSGNIGNGAAPVEHFTFGVNMTTAFDPGSLVDSGNAFWPDVVADCRAFFQDPGALIHGSSRLKEVKVAHIGADGKYTGDPHIFACDDPGGANADELHPPQVALAVSLHTERRGATGRGRFYLPTPSVHLDRATGCMTTANRDQVANAVQTFLNNLNNAVGNDAVANPVVVVASRKGYNSPVTACRVGVALDTVRSRRRSLKENYSPLQPVS